MTAVSRESGPRLLFFVTEDWYFVSHRLALAVAAKSAGYNVTVVARASNHAHDIRAAGLRLIEFENVRTGLNPITELHALARLIRVYRRERPDIVHHVAMKPVLYGSVAARLSGRPRVVNALAGLGWLFSTERGAAVFIKPVVRRGLRYLLQTGIVLVQNRDDARFLIQLGVPEANVRRIPGAGVDLRQFQPTTEPSGMPVVLLAARLLWDKGVGDFVAAARIVRAKNVQARFVLAGVPDELNPSAISQEQLAEWVGQDVVEHLGWVEDMATLLADSHIVCLPSYYGEGIPKSLIEAAAAGRPIITTDMPGCREIVRDGYNGILVPPRDPVALAAALMRLIEDAELRHKMGANSRTRAQEEFGLDAVIRQTLALYVEALR